MHNYTCTDGSCTYTTSISVIRNVCIASQRCTGRYGNVHVAVCYDSAEKRIFSQDITDVNSVIDFSKRPSCVHFATLSVPTTQYIVASLLDTYSLFLGTSHLITRHTN